MLDARELGYQISGSWLVRHINLTATKGQVLCLVGPNGAGKSTLLRILSGELRASEGTVFLNGRDLRQWSSEAMACFRACLPQHRGSAFPFTVLEMVLMGRIPHPGGWWANTEDLRIAEEAMRRCSVQQLSGRAYSTLSGGEAARVDLARIFTQEPQLLLLDEPTNHLDLANQYSILQLCRAMADDGATVVAVLHDLNLAACFADQIALMHKGCMITSGVPWEVLTSSHIQAAYGLPCDIWEHPGGYPWVVPLPGAQNSSTGHGTATFNQVITRRHTPSIHGLRKLRSQP